MLVYQRVQDTIGCLHCFYLPAIYGQSLGIVHCPPVIKDGNNHNLSHSNSNLHLWGISMDLTKNSWLENPPFISFIDNVPMKPSTHFGNLPASRVDRLDWSHLPGLQRNLKKAIWLVVADRCWLVTRAKKWCHYICIYIYVHGPVSPVHGPPTPYGMGGYPPRLPPPHHIHRGEGYIDICIYTHIHIHIYILYTFAHTHTTYVYNLHI